MAIVKITELPAADSPVSPTDVAAVVQNGVTKKAAVNQLGFRAAGGNAVTRTIESKLQDLINAKDFGVVGDGVADDTAALQFAINAATAAGKNLYVPKGTYFLTARVNVTCGIIGDGSANTTFLAKNNGVYEDEFILYISGGHLFQGFTSDGACSPDPLVWNSNTVDAFTGWKPLLFTGMDQVVIQDVIGQNSCLGAAFRLDGCENVLIENCQAIRGRGSFGDGFYHRESSRITHVNCRAYDVTRIGFVSEGSSVISSQVTYIACYAEYAHDQSADYGGGEFNAGFWFENANLTTCIDCVSNDTGDRGFTFAGTTVSQSSGYSVNQAQYVNCAAIDATTGFLGNSLSSAIEATVTYDNCTATSCNIGFSFANATATVNNGSYFIDGGDSQTRAFLTGSNSVVYINNFYEEWTNQPATVIGTVAGNGSIATFSTQNPKQVIVDGYRTHNDAYFTVKYLNTSTSTIVVKNGVLYTPDCRVGSFTVQNCTVDALTCIVSGTFTLKDSYVKTTANVSMVGDVSYVQVSNCQFNRTSESAIPLEITNASNTTELPKMFVNTCSFVGNVETGSALIYVNTSTALASTTRCADINVNGCTFYNTGGATANPPILLSRGSGTSSVYSTSNWYSASLSNFATRTSAGSTFAALL